MAHNFLGSPLERFRKHLFVKVILDKLLSTKAASMALALILAICGCVMIFHDIRDDGFIDIKTPFITGHAKSGFVGVSLIMVSLIVTVIAILSGATIARAVASRAGAGGKQKIKIQIGHQSCEWEGELNYWEEANHVGNLLKSVHESFLGISGNKDQSHKSEREMENEETPRKKHLEHGAG